MSVGLIAPPTKAKRLRRRLSPRWSVVEMWLPEQVLANAGRCHVVLYAPPQEGSTEDDQARAVRAAISDAGIPLVSYGPLGRYGSLSRFAMPRRERAALPRPHDDQVVDILLDAAFDSLLHGVADEVRASTGADATLLLFLGDLIDHGVRPFREAATLMTNGDVPFVRQIHHVGRGNELRRRYLMRQASDAGIDLGEFLRRNTLLQGVVRYTPERAYRTAVRLGFATPDGFRMAMKRGLRATLGADLGLKDLCTVAVRPLAEMLRVPMR